MFRLTIKELLGKKLRLLSTAMAVLLGVAFLAGTLILTDTATKTFDNVLADANAGTAAYVRGVSPLEPLLRRPAAPHRRRRWSSTLAPGRRRRPRPRRKVNGYAQIVDKHGQAGRRRRQGARSSAANWVTVDALNPYRARRRAMRRAPPTRSSSTSTRPTPPGYHVGDRAKVLTTGAPADVHRSPASPRSAAPSSAGGATSVLFTDAHRPAAARPARSGRRHRVHRRSRASRSATLAANLAAGRPATTSQVVTGATARRRGPEGAAREHLVVQHLHADLRRHRDVRRCVHHQQHLLHHGGAAHQGDGDAAVDRRQSPSGDAGGASSRPASSAWSPPALGLRRRHRCGRRAQGDARLGRHGRSRAVRMVIQPSTIVVSLAVGIVVTLVSATMPARAGVEGAADRGTA